MMGCCSRYWLELVAGQVDERVLRQTCRSFLLTAGSESENGSDLIGAGKEEAMSGKCDVKMGIGF